jgi:type I restriction enzyme S subunit
VTPGIPTLGERPQGWQSVTFRDVFDVVQRKVDMQDETEYQLVTAKRSRGGVVPRNILAGKDILTKTQYFIKEGDFLISRRQIIHGACGVVPHDLDGAIVSNEYTTLRTREGLLLDFLSHFTHTIYFQQTCFQASVGVDVEKMIFDLEEWFKYTVYLPPLPEQRRIADILGTWDRAIRLTEQRIAAQQQRKRALMQHLLTGRRRFREFAGREWEEVKLSNVAEINPSALQFERDISVSFIKMEDVSEDAKVVGQSIRSSSEVSKSGYTPFCDNDVIVAKITPCFENGKGALLKNLVGGIGYGSTEFHVLRPKPYIHSSFLYYVTTSYPFRSRGKSNMRGSAGQKRVPVDFIRDFTFSCPPLAEQQRIAAVLQAADSELALLAARRAALQRQKHGLMQQLLTGRVRVPLPEPHTKGADDGDNSPLP